MTRKIVIGGPAYNMQVSAKHADSIAFLGIAFSHHEWAVDYWHKHNSVLVANRDELLRGCVENNIDIFISIDSDTYLDENNIQSSVEATVSAAEWLYTVDIESAGLCPFAIVAPVMQRNGKWNVLDAKTGTHYIDRPTERLYVPYHAPWCAFAFSIYRVISYAEWVESKEPLYMFAYLKDAEQKWVGEDVWHCNQIVKRGGVVIVEPNIITGHAV